MMVSGEGTLQPSDLDRRLSDVERLLDAHLERLTRVQAAVSRLIELGGAGDQIGGDRRELDQRAPAIEERAHFECAVDHPAVGTAGSDGDIEVVQAPGGAAAGNRPVRLAVVQDLDEGVIGGQGGRDLVSR